MISSGLSESRQGQHIIHEERKKERSEMRCVRGGGRKASGKEQKEQERSVIRPRKSNSRIRLIIGFL